MHRPVVPLGALGCWARSRCLRLLMVAMALAACSDTVDVADQPEPALSVEAMVDDEIQSMFHGEAAFVDLAAEIPAFGGFFFEGGRVVALTSDPSQAANVREAVERAWATRLSRSLKKSLLGVARKKL